MSCNRLSLGALALTLSVSLAGLVLAYGAISAAAQRASSARHNLKATVAAGLLSEDRAIKPLSIGPNGQSS